MRGLRRSSLGKCASAPEAIGCYDGDIRVSTRDVSFTYYCVEETVLVHEVGHAVIGDPDHLDYPRRMLHVVADRIRWLETLAEAHRRAAGNQDPADVSVIAA